MGQRGPFSDISYNVFNRRKASYLMIQSLNLTISRRMDKYEGSEHTEIDNCYVYSQYLQKPVCQVLVLQSLQWMLITLRLDNRDVLLCEAFPIHDHCVSFTGCQYRTRSLRSHATRMLFISYLFFGTFRYIFCRLFGPYRITKRNIAIFSLQLHPAINSAAEICTSSNTASKRKQ